MGVGWREGERWVLGSERVFIMRGFVSYRMNLGFYFKSIGSY